MTTKQFYETPTTKTLVVRFQGVLCASLTYGNQGAAGGDIESGNEYDL